MNKLCLSIAIVALPLAGCATTGSSTSNALMGAGIGSVAGAALGAATGGMSLIAGAAIGAAVGAGSGVLISEIDRSRPITGDVREGTCVSSDVPGYPVDGRMGAAWADLDLDGCVDGYVQSGRYYRR